MSELKEYNADSISYLEGLEQIRRRPDMYMGGTTGNNPPALFRMIREIIDNSLDEFLGNHSKNLYVIVDSSLNEYTVIDDGRGIPTDINSKSGKSALTLVFTQIHAGGKFDKDSYKVSSGKNGVGNKGTNALSEYLTVWSNNNSTKTWMGQTFKQGKPQTDVINLKLPKEIKSFVKKTGTVVKFKPDSDIFKDNTIIDLKRLNKELSDIQYLCPKLTIHLIIDGSEQIFYSEKGIVELTTTNNDEFTPFIYSDDSMDVAVNFTKNEGTSFKSFVNICHTDMGGTHLNGLKKTICNVIKDNSKNKIINDDILEGVIGAIHYRMAEPQYQGQTKNELTSAEPEKIIIDVLTPVLQKYFRKNKELLNRIVSYAEKMLEQRNKMKASKDLLKGLKNLNAGSKYISDKFLDADRRKYKNTADLEMFIVEGDSAGGHFKQAREAYQGELKLRGKIINAAKATPEELFGKPQKKGEAKCEGNREIKDLVAALGCGIQDDYDESKLRFGKVICLCFTGDTKVKLLDGTEKTFEELVKYEAEHPNTEYYVYSVDEFGSFVPGKATHPRITGYTKELVELTLDNGSSFKCTPNHLIMLRDGSYKEAKDIELTDSLMPLYTKYNDNVSYNNGRELYFDNKTGKWVFTHQTVSNLLNDATKAGQQIHHIDENYLNNNPNNLMIMNTLEHRLYHNKSLNNCATEALNIIKEKRYNINYDHNERIKNNIFTKKNGMAKIGKTVYEKGLELNEDNYMLVRKELGSVRVPKYENLTKYFESETQFKEYCKNYNHKIVNKKFITLDNEIPVYDLTVENYHNFMLGGNCNIICHNCDADSDGGHITNLIAAFFVNYMPDLIKNGHLYIIDAPLFMATGAKNKVFGMTRGEVDKQMKAAKCSDYTVTRLKGWGECSPEQLSELCLNPKTRKLIQIKWTDITEKACEDTMGEDTAFRKELLGIK